MTFQTADKIQESTTTTGTGALTLSGATTGHKAFSSICANGDVCYYSIDGGADWEVGLGTWGSGNLLTRTTLIASSTGSAVSFSAGTKIVSLTGPASKVLQQDDSGNINLPVASSVVVPPASSINLLAKNLGGRILPAFSGPSGLDSTVQPHLGRNRSVAWQPIGNATTVPIIDGIAAPTAIGTATSRSVATTNISTRIKRLGYVSVATAGGLAGHYFTAAQYAIGNGSGLGGLHHITRFVVSDAAAVTGARQFIGWQNVVSVPTNVEPSTLTNCFGLAQLSTDATQWYIVYGGSAAQTAIALGTTIGAPTLTNTAWDLIFFCPPNSNNTVSYMLQNLSSGVTVSGTLTGTAGTALPLSTALLALRAWRCNNATALSVGLDIASHYIETDQ